MRTTSFENKLINKLDMKKVEQKQIYKPTNKENKFKEWEVSLFKSENKELKWEELKI